jgi:hypothetical protein
VSVRVEFTARAEQQAFALPKEQRNQVAELIRQLKARGCAALDYRLTGDLPVGRLCVKHLGRNYRALVAFASVGEIWVLLVGPHDDQDPGIDVYTELYRLAGFTAPPPAARDKPPCCDDNGLAPVLDSLLEDLVARAARLRQTRQQR